MKTNPEMHPHQSTHPTITPEGQRPEKEVRTEGEANSSLTIERDIQRAAEDLSQAVSSAEGRPLTTEQRQILKDIVRRAREATVNFFGKLKNIFSNKQEQKEETNERNDDIPTFQEMKKYPLIEFMSQREEGKIQVLKDQSGRYIFFYDVNNSTAVKVYDKRAGIHNGKGKLSQEGNRNIIIMEDERNTFFTVDEEMGTMTPIYNNQDAAHSQQPVLDTSTIPPKNAEENHPHIVESTPVEATFEGEDTDAEKTVLYQTATNEENLEDETLELDTEPEIIEDVEDDEASGSVEDNPEVVSTAPDETLSSPGNVVNLNDYRTPRDNQEIHERTLKLQMGNDFIKCMRDKKITINSAIEDKLVEHAKNLTFGVSRGEVQIFIPEDKDKPLAALNKLESIIFLERNPEYRKLLKPVSMKVAATAYEPETPKMKMPTRKVS